MNKPLVSVVVPVYNAEKYLDDLMQNVLLAQTYDNLEIIMVDDHSTDNSSEMMECYAAEDDRIKIIKPDFRCGNADCSNAVGLEHCTGEYYFYLSQDDFIDKDCIEKLVNRALETGADTVLPDMIWYYGEGEDNSKGIFPPNGDYNTVLTGPEAFLMSMDWQVHGFPLKSMELMRRINYRYSWFSCIEFFTRKAYLLSEKVVYADTKFYYRQDNPDAITKGLKYFSCDYLHILIGSLKLIKEHNLYYPDYDRQVKFLEQAVSFRRHREYFESCKNFTQLRYMIKSVMASRKEYRELLRGDYSNNL